MVDLLLNTSYSVRSGNWDLYLICLQNVVPYTFVYDNYNYARYLTPMLGTMLDLENTHPFTFNHFKQGLFTSQLTEGQNFTRIEPDKVIEMTRIQKDEVDFQEMKEQYTDGN